LIETAAQFERLKLYAVDFLKDLEESVCILLLDGLTYTFTHRLRAPGHGDRGFRLMATSISD
jgi:hypothetical protein